MVHYVGTDGDLKLLRQVETSAWITRVRSSTGILLIDFAKDIQKLATRVSHDFAAKDGEKLPLVSFYHDPVKTVSLILFCAPYSNMSDYVGITKYADTGPPPLTHSLLCTAQLAVC